MAEVKRPDPRKQDPRLRGAVCARKPCKEQPTAVENVHEHGMVWSLTLCAAHRAEIPADHIMKEWK